MLARREGFEALEQRIRSDFSVQDHQGRTRLLPFRVAGSAREGLRMETRFLYPGSTPQRPERVVVYFESASAAPRLADVARVEWRADGASIAMRDVERTWSRSQIGVIERVSGTLQLADFLALAGARRLEVRVGPVAFDVTAPDHEALRHFASKIPGTAPARRAP